jgi:hypothetical protein
MFYEQHYRSRPYRELRRLQHLGNQFPFAIASHHC